MFQILRIYLMKVQNSFRHFHFHPYKIRQINGVISI